jgi:glutathione-regulated potassium-efflux system ancillary protein KefC
MEHNNDWLSAALIFLASAVLIVPLAKRLGLGAILGYLAAGIGIGPFGLKLVAEPESILHVAEFGVVLMLFLVGLELEPRRLWSMRKPIFGWGSTQLGFSAAALMGVGLMAGLSWQVALVAGLALAMSSTAIGLGVLGERNLLPTRAGQGVLAVSLFQDIAAIPILAVVPLLVVHESSGTGSGWLGAAKAFGMIALLVGVGRLLLRPSLRWIARSKTPELFTAASLLLVVAAAALMRAAGLSMALGAFLAGVLLAESEYRRELETDLEPFKGLLLGLFFMAVGMSIDFSVLWASPGLIALLVVGFLLIKALVVGLMARHLRLAVGERPFFTLLLAQGGEFGFVVTQTGLTEGVLESRLASTLLGAIALSMLLTPLLLAAVDRWWLPRLAQCDTEGKPAAPTLEEEQHAPVIIAGFGRYGQIVGRMLSAQGLRATVLDVDAEQVASVRKFGWEAFYGDATRLDLLRTAGAGRAKVLVVALDDVEQSEELVKLAVEHFPQLTLVARARNVTHYNALRRLGVQHIQRETFESALLSAREVLEQLGLGPHEARQLAQAFKVHNEQQLDAMLPHFGDEQQLIAIAKQGRQQLETLWAEQRAQGESRRGNWRETR